MTLKSAIAATFGLQRQVPSWIQSELPPGYGAVDAADYLRSRWPQCLQAKQPPELPKEIGGASVLERWARDARKFRLRLPVKSTEGPCWPFPRRWRLS